MRDPDPVVFLENELMYGTTFDIDDNVLDEDYVVPIGKAKIMREGKDITLVSHSIGKIYIKILLCYFEMNKDEIFES